MTNEEAAALLKQTQIFLARGNGKVLLAEALRLAISALEERKKGKWMHKKITADFHVVGQCSVCKERKRIDNFCPNCGTDMRGENNG